MFVVVKPSSHHQWQDRELQNKLFEMYDNIPLCRYYIFCRFCACLHVVNSVDVNIVLL